ncbi:MAG: FdhD protein [Clostridia bacterium]|jgi:FdhD protein|nr:FdhD protein [Clostridia bacterium]MDN5322473.1 FdhD protein [Clostridia bacterium]
MFKKQKIFQYSSKYGIKEITSLVAGEEQVTIFLNNQEIVALLCSPIHLNELAVGFLTLEGLICQDNKYLEIEISRDKKQVYVFADQVVDLDKRWHKKTITSGCGMGTSFTDFQKINLQLNKNNSKITFNQITLAMKEFQKHSLVENGTGGVHSAGIHSDDEIIIRKDVGRHNAVDKIFGHCILSSIETTNKMLLLTGRISSEIIFKGAKMGIPIVASLSSATSLAIEMAEQLGITILGYVKGERAYVYSHPDKIK